MMNPVDFEHELNNEQLAAVQAPDGPALVIAAAGTGKTRTLTYRVAWLVEKDIDPSRILLLTFTNRAAKEMLARAEGLVGSAVGGLWGGTFHHMANRLLRVHADQIGYQADYTILDQDDSKSLVRACASEMDLLGKHFPKPEVLLSVFSLAANMDVPAEDVAHKRFDEHEVNIDDVLRVHEAYMNRKRSLNAMDFDDLLCNGLKLFRECPDVREKYQQKFKYVLVDEYQDTNHIQAEWVDAIAGLHRNLMVVGDDFQSIYSWRGADFRNIMSFPERYSDASVYMLETNYRSVPEVLDVANACIAGNPDQFQKSLKAVKESYTKPKVVHVRDGEQQSRYVVERVNQLLRNGYKLKDIVVLYRSHFHSMEVQMQLARARISYEVTSGVRFFEQAHIKDVCTLVRLLVNPSDELAFTRLMELFPKVGKKTAYKIWRKLGERWDMADAEYRKVLRDALPKAAMPLWEDIDKGVEFQDVATFMADPGELVYRFVKHFYGEYIVETYDNAQHRLEDIDELVDFTGKFESAESFLSEMALYTNLDAEEEAIHPMDEGKLRLTTIHQAKGLEWNAVIILWMTDGMFPSTRSLNESDTLAEERRLFYVATTRAKNELFLCIPEIRKKHDGGVIVYEPSRFIQEVDPALLEEEYIGFI